MDYMKYGFVFFFSSRRRHTRSSTVSWARVCIRDRFLADDGSLKDPKGYHKAMYAARNADTIAQHFYEQGKADAVKDVVAKSKNITTEARKEGNAGSVFVNGIKVKSISGADSSKLKIKTRKFN